MVDLQRQRRVTEAQQADYLVKAYRRLESYPYVRAALQYSFRNVVWRGEDALDDRAHLGLLRIDFSRKPAYYAFKGYAPGTGFARPRGVGSTRVWLVPALAPCTAPNRVHGPALAFGSCTPPRPVSDYAMIGTQDRNAQPSNGAGFIRYRPIMGDPSTETDEADMAIRVNMLDVRVRGTLEDYAGELEARVPVRRSDRANGSGASETGTVQDHSFAVAVPCSGTADTTIGATCSTATTADAVLPGVVREGDRAVWSWGRYGCSTEGPTRMAVLTAEIRCSPSRASSSRDLALHTIVQAALGHPLRPQALPADPCCIGLKAYRAREGTIGC